MNSPEKLSGLWWMLETKHTTFTTLQFLICMSSKKYSWKYLEIWPYHTVLLYVLKLYTAPVLKAGNSALISHDGKWTQLKIKNVRNTHFETSVGWMQSSWSFTDCNRSQHESHEYPSFKSEAQLGNPKTEVSKISKWTTSCPQLC